MATECIGPRSSALCSCAVITSYEVRCSIVAVIRVQSVTPPIAGSRAVTNNSEIAIIQIVMPAVRQ